MNKQESAKDKWKREQREMREADKNLSVPLMPATEASQNSSPIISVVLSVLVAALLILLIVLSNRQYSSNESEPKQPLAITAESIQKDITRLENSLIELNTELISIRSEYTAKARQLSTVNARMQYDDIVRNGDAGSTEMLILAKKQMDNPSYQSQNASEQSTITSQLDITKLKMENYQSKVASTEKELHEKELELSQIQHKTIP